MRPRRIALCNCREPQSWTLYGVAGAQAANELKYRGMEPFEYVNLLHVLYVVSAHSLCANDPEVVLIAPQAG